MQFHKYQALGNDYVVLDAVGLEPRLQSPLVSRICDRHFGLGSDGILVEALAPEGTFGLRILNPDGSEAEKSGNGLRIFARYLWDTGRVGGGGEAFDVVTLGGTVRCEVRESGRSVFVEMGNASFDSERIPVAGPRREVVGETIEVDGERFGFTAVTVGNPHCVVHVNEVSPALAQRLGPLIENHPLFPNRTNVQFVQVVDQHRIRIEIWERGAGYTLASGSSSCAAAAASVRRGFCHGDVCVVMPGGTLDIGVAADFGLTMLGPVEKVASGTLADELLAHGADW
ncbi:MAG: diaminopimelate epimerase [Coriobacteriia bacterium]|nr:diaminopimelate epimerase [Coriobacteriia bacterium]